jgi:thymidylate synthase (FAD)
MDVLDKGYVELLDSMGTDNTVVSAARVSHLGESKGIQKDAELIRYLMKERHTSPFEHVVFQFRIKCPLFVARQWMRHRTWSYNEVSRRYTSEKIDFHYPDNLRFQHLVDKQNSDGSIDPENFSLFSDRIMYLTEAAIFLYEDMLAAGVAREQARMVLPQNMYTSFYGTVDLHNLFHFLELRRSPHAQEEIRAYAYAIERLISRKVPICYNAWLNKMEGKL